MLTIINEKELMNQLSMFYDAGFEWMRGNKSSQQFRKIGYLAFDLLTEEEYQKERRKKWRESKTTKSFKVWNRENPDIEVISIYHELSLFRFDMTEILRNTEFNPFEEYEPEDYEDEE